MNRWILGAAVLSFGALSSSAMAQISTAPQFGGPGAAPNVTPVPYPPYNYNPATYNKYYQNQEHFSGDRQFWTRPFWNMSWLPANQRAQAIYRMPTLPVYMAAPWYNYWPYDGHFQTAAPPFGGYGNYPATVNYPGNAFFPAQQGIVYPGAGYPGVSNGFGGTPIPVPVNPGTVPAPRETLPPPIAPVPPGGNNPGGLVPAPKKETIPGGGVAPNPTPNPTPAPKKEAEPKVAPAPVGLSPLPVAPGTSSVLGIP